MKIEIVERRHIRIKDELDPSFDLYTLNEGGIQIISTETKQLEVEDRLPRSIIVREK